MKARLIGEPYLAGNRQAWGVSATDASAMRVPLTSRSHCMYGIGMGTPGRVPRASP